MDRGNLTEERVRQIFREEFSRSRNFGDDPLFDFSGAREFLGDISESSLRRQIKSGKIKPQRLGSRVLFRRSALEAALE